MQGLSINRKADTIKYEYFGTWTHKDIQYNFVINVVKHRDDKPYVESLEWLEDEPEDVDDDEIIYHFAINHKYDI